MPRLRYTNTGEYSLCKANEIVYGKYRKILAENSLTLLLPEITSLVKDLREAYEAEDNADIKECIISFDDIGEKTTIKKKEFETFPFPHPKVETKTVGEHGTQEDGVYMKGQCIGYYSFAYLIKWMTRNPKWPTDNTEMTQEEVAYLTNLANYFYKDKNDPRFVEEDEEDDAANM